MSNQQDTHAHQFEALRSLIARNMDFLSGTQLFHTKPETSESKLSDIFLTELLLDALDTFDRHDCRACFDFLDTYGNLAYIDVDGSTVPALFPADPEYVPEIYKESVRQMYDFVKKSKISDVFIADKAFCGDATVTDKWSHLYFKTPMNNIHADPAVTRRRQQEVYKENFLALRRLLKHDISVFAHVSKLTNADRWPERRARSHARWLLDLKKVIDRIPQHLQDNVIWLNVVTAPFGFAAPNDKGIWAAIANAANGHFIDYVVGADQACRAPHKSWGYDPPRTSVSEAKLLERSRNIVKELRLQPALLRRRASLQEIKQFAFWSPSEEAVPDSTLPIISKEITWEQFLTEYLHKIIRLQVFVPDESELFAGISTAVFQDAPPIFDWDYPSARNSFSWFRFDDRTAKSCHRFRLSPDFHDVLGLFLLPPYWVSKYCDDLRDNAFIAIKGAGESFAIQSGVFPKAISTRLQKLSEVIANKSRRICMGQAPEGEQSATGMIFGELTDRKIDLRFRATLEDLGDFDFHINSWD